MFSILAVKDLNFAAYKSGSARMHGFRESTMAPFNEGHLLSVGGIGVGYPVFIEINEKFSAG